MSARRSQHSRVVMITGASTGIGLELARMLHDSPHRIVVTARKESLDRFNDTGLQENSHFLIRPMDVAVSDERIGIVEEAYMRWGKIDVLINNAAISYRAVIEHLNAEHEMIQFRTNFFGPMHLIRLVLPHMREKRCGHIINVSSVGGMMAMPTMGAYSASKFALEGASESLWYEVRPWGINVCLIEPGFIHSNAFRKVRRTEKSERAESEMTDPYHFVYHYMGGFIEKMMNHAVATPEDIAAKIIRVMNKPRPPLRIPVTVDAWFFFYLRRLLPRGLYHDILYRFLPHVNRWVTE